MTPITLISDLAAELRLVVSDFTLIAELQAKKPVAVYEQYLPTDRFAVDTFYPLIVVSLLGTEDAASDSVAEVNITLGVFGGYAEDGWRDLLNIAERVRQFLLNNPVVAEKYARDYPILFEVLADQPDPFLYANFNVKFRIGQPRLLCD